jgi:carbamoyl-phosphate synthase large subunit
MKPINVLLTPSSSGMAIAAIKALRLDKNIKIVSTDVSELAAGLYLSDKAYIVPPFNDDSFFDKLDVIIAREKIDVIIPCLDTILLEFSKRKAAYEQLGVKILVSEPETIKITRDKWETYKKLENIIPLPKSFVNTDIDIPFPVFIKPRFGSGSIDAFRANSRDQLNFFFSKVSNPIIQEFLPGKEYTIDCLAGVNGELIVSIPRERIETKAGISVKSKTVENHDLDVMACKVSNALRFYGPFFLQVKEDVNGIPKLTEINARIGGTMCLSSFSGSNLHVLAVYMAMGRVISPSVPQKGLYVSRYWEEIYLTEDEINKKVLRI